MTRASRTRAGGILSAALLALTVSACSGDPVEPTPTTPTTTVEETTEAPQTEEPTTEPTTPQPTQTEEATTAPTAEATETATTVPPPTAGAGGGELAAFLPAGFPIPDELTITGDPTATAENWQVTFTVPDPVETFDFYLEQLPAAGYDLQAGTSEAYSREVSSGAILASDGTRDVNLLIVDDEVEISITTR